jgi:malonyl-CoA decarboxylase
MAVVKLTRAWREFKGAARLGFGADINPNLPDNDIKYLSGLLNECLGSNGGVISSKARLVEIGRIYCGLTRRGKKRFFRLLADNFDFDMDNVNTRIHALQTVGNRNEEERVNAVSNLYESLISPRYRILKKFGILENGFKFLVDMRADLLDISKNDISLNIIERDLKLLLESMFDIGLLDMNEITWNSPAVILEKLIAYEAVHEISSWKDLKNRLDSDRKCFAFFHIKMVDEPLIFVEVALGNGIADNIQQLLNIDEPVVNPKDADTAIFYSISNAQKGLNGISLGNFLIKQVVTKVSSELKNIKTFATLSPVPGFTRWLKEKLGKEGAKIFLDAELKEIKKVKHHSDIPETLIKMIDQPYSDDSGLRVFSSAVMRLAAVYLTQAKKGKRALDPVAHFHFSNGASLERINWLANSSPKGMKESMGMMVNYLYDVSSIDENHEAYAGSGTIRFSKKVRDLLRCR